jgi:predicted transcriptional regulator
MSLSKKERLAGHSDLFHMAVIGATAAAHHVEIGQLLQQGGILQAQFDGVAVIQIGCFVCAALVMPMASST